MALLFLKQKLFPNRNHHQQQQQQQQQRRFSSTSDSNGYQSRDGLLEVDSDTTYQIHNEHNHDLEAQLPRSYHTFQHNDSSHVEQDPEVSSTSSSGRSRINPRIVSDSILGLSDGLTVPFALSAGLSALGNTKVVVLGGLAELAAGAISMGLGGYVGAKSEAESYQTIVRETNELISASPSETASIVHATFSKYGLSDEAISEINISLHSSPDRLLEFLIAFHHKESEPDCNQAWISAVTLAVGYFVGGFIPLIPYFFVDQVMLALYWSIGVMGVTLFVFGYVKTCIVRGWVGRDHAIEGIKGGIQMCVVGGVAAGAAIGLVRLIDSGTSN